MLKFEAGELAAARRWWRPSPAWTAQRVGAHGRAGTGATLALHARGQWVDPLPVRRAGPDVPARSLLAHGAGAAMDSALDGCDDAGIGGGGAAGGALRVRRHGGAAGRRRRRAATRGPADPGVRGGGRGAGAGRAARRSWSAPWAAGWPAWRRMRSRPRGGSRGSSASAIRSTRPGWLEQVRTAHLAVLRTPALIVQARATRWVPGTRSRAMRCCCLSDPSAGGRRRRPAAAQEVFVIVGGGSIWRRWWGGWQPGAAAESGEDRDLHLRRVNRRLGNCWSGWRRRRPDVAQPAGAEGDRRRVSAAGDPGGRLRRALARAADLQSRRDRCANAEPALTRDTLPGDPADTQARYIEAAVQGVLIASPRCAEREPAAGPEVRRQAGLDGAAAGACRRPAGGRTAGGAGQHAERSQQQGVIVGTVIAAAGTRTATSTRRRSAHRHPPSGQDDRDQGLPGRQARSRRHPPGGQGDRRDRRGPTRAPRPRRVRTTYHKAFRTRGDGRVHRPAPEPSDGKPIGFKLCVGDPRRVHGRSSRR